MTLFPVVMPVHLQTKGNHNSPCPSYLKRGGLSGPEKVDYLSRIAREALRLSAQKTGVRLGKLPKDENGVPCPVAGIYWSLSHKPKYVAAVVSKDKVGIDIEEIKPRDELLFARVASDEEWELKERSWDTLFRYWTAKEAILKIIGIGIGGLKICRITSVPNENHITLDYKGQFFLVEQLRNNNHIVSVLKNDNQIEWVVLDKSQIPSTKS
jgi:4'-phosphopantetheinyl transferase